jgi:CheY-like chemotaxis protein
MEKRILVVEDNDDIRDSIVRVLALQGFRVDGACNGYLALQKLRHEEDLPSLLVLDLNMPVMDGWQLVTELKKDARLAAVPFVLYSDCLQLEQIAASVGAVAYVAKSQSVRELLRVVERCGTPPSSL